jgi:hypothetical protein
VAELPGFLQALEFCCYSGVDLACRLDAGLQILGAPATCETISRFQGSAPDRLRLRQIVAATFLDSFGVVSQKSSELLPSDAQLGG